MDKPIIPDNEVARIEALKALNILDTQSEESFDRITRLAHHMFNVPVALISLVDEDRQWFKSCFGVDARQTPRDISFCGHTILDDKPLIINDTLNDPRFADNPLVTQVPNIRFYAGYPIQLPCGVRIGTVCIIDTKPRNLSKKDIQALRDLVHITQRELAILQLATRDELTNIPNRRGFTLMAERYLDLCIRQQLHAMVIFIDLDSFKPINDQYGHAKGDDVLRLFSSLLCDSCRKSDLYGRFGGDEFVLMLTGSATADIEVLIARIEQGITEYFNQQSSNIALSFSYGLAEFDPNKPISLEELLKTADENMYKNKLAKKAG